MPVMNSNHPGAMIDAAAPQPNEPEICQLSHRLFTALGTPLFRRSESDGVPVMVVPLGEREAVLPIVAVQREFGITLDSDDGRMLALVAASLDFVSALRVGDPLPSEVLSGAASWTPDPEHLRIATARLRLQLIDWLNPDGGNRPELDAISLLTVAEDPRLREQVQDALIQAAATLGLEISRRRGAAH